MCIYIHCPLNATNCSSTVMHEIYTYLSCKQWFQMTYTSLTGSNTSLILVLLNLWHDNAIYLNINFWNLNKSYFYWRENSHLLCSIIVKHFIFILKHQLSPIFSFLHHLFPSNHFFIYLPSVFVYSRTISNKPEQKIIKDWRICHMRS